MVRAGAGGRAGGRAGRALRRHTEFCCPSEAVAPPTDDNGTDASTRARSSGADGSVEDGSGADGDMESTAGCAPTADGSGADGTCADGTGADGTGADDSGADGSVEDGSGADEARSARGSCEHDELHNVSMASTGVGGQVWRALRRRTESWRRAAGLTATLTLFDVNGDARLTDSSSESMSH